MVATRDIVLVVGSSVWALAPDLTWEPIDDLTRALATPAEPSQAFIPVATTKTNVVLIANADAELLLLAVKAR